ncbi:MAG: 30S ribosomal protein S15 [Candidatus Aenigmarchaeota archaeon]|nr:30S ribosomal protein S15 [Candidatus Aenigmarchaeota archaeon]
MARIYAKKSGKSGSKKPLIPAQWVTYTGDEVERLVVKLGKDGVQAAQIGLTLRDQYGIPSVRAVTKKTIMGILEGNGMKKAVPDELFNLLKRAVNLRKHLGNNKRDSHSKRALELLESRIRRVAKYYIANERLPESWKYNAEQAKLLVEKGA